MIGNLLSNAHKYGQPPIVLRTRACAGRPEFLCIDVQDHGPGVSAEFQPQLFREFSRGSGTVVAGTGLGLHVVRNLAEAQGGTVSYSAAPRRGAIFTLTLATPATPDAEGSPTG
jgi:signal transduction histidine kinase